MSKPVFGSIGLFVAMLCPLPEWGMNTCVGQSPDLQYELSFARKTETYYVRTDPDWEPGQMEIHEMLPEIRVDSVVRSVYADNTQRTVIYHLQDNTVEPWMTAPYRTIIDMDRVKTVDAVGNQLVKMDHTAEMQSTLWALKDSLDNSGGNLVPEFPKMTAKRRNLLLSQGFTVQKLSGGNFLCKKDSIQLLINNNKRTLERMVIRPDSSVAYYYKEGYRKNAYGQVVPFFKVERTPDTRFPEGLVYRIALTNYSNYFIASAGGAKWLPEGAAAPEFVLYPNPAYDQTILAWDEPLQEVAEIRVIDMAGRLIRTDRVTNTDQYILPVADWEPGIYIVMVIINGHQVRETFVKL